MVLSCFFLTWLHLSRMNLGVYCRQKLQNKPNKFIVSHPASSWCCSNIIYAYSSGSPKPHGPLQSSVNTSLDSVVGRLDYIPSSIPARYKFFSFTDRLRDPLNFMFLVRSKAAGAWIWPSPYSAQVKNEWSYICALYAFMAWTKNLRKSKAKTS